MDDYQRARHTLTQKLMLIREDVQRLNELRDSSKDNRDPMIIRKYTDNYNAIKHATEVWQQLADALAEDERRVSKGKKKIEADEMEDRRRFVQLTGEEIQELTRSNSRAQVQITSEDLAIEQRRQRRSSCLSLTLLSFDTHGGLFWAM